MNSNKLLNLIVAFLFSFQLQAQFSILENTVVQVGDNVNMISKYDVINNGALLFGESFFILDANFTNKGSLDLSSLTLKLGTRNSTGSYILNVSDKAESINLRQLILESNSANFTASSLSSGTLRITESLESVSGTLEANGKVVIANTTTTDAAQVKKSLGGSVNNIVIERYIPAKRAYRLLASPVTSPGSINDNLQEGQNNTGTTFPADNLNNNPGYGTHITGSKAGNNGFDATLSGNPSMYYFNQTNQDWDVVTNTDGNTLQVGEGYLLMVRGSREVNLTSNTATPSITTLRVLGDLHIGDFSPDMAIGGGDFSLIANPYQAVVDFSLVEKSNLTDYIYLWEASFDDGGENPRGKYITVDVPNNSNPGSSTLNKYIMPGQSFFVQNRETPLSSPAITFKETHKKVVEPQVNPFSVSSDITAVAMLYKEEAFQNGRGETDAALVRFNSNYQTQADSEDAIKFWNLDENLAVLNNGYRSIDKRNFPGDGETIDLFINNYGSDNYILEIKLNTQLDKNVMYLKDSYLDVLTVVNDKIIYPFEVDENNESKNSDRFSLVFENVTLSQENFENPEVSLYPNPTKGRIKIEANSTIESIEVFDVQGRLLYAVNQADSVDISHLNTGIYLIKIETSEGYSTTKVIKY